MKHKPALPLVNTPGSGNSGCRTPKSVMVRLNNQPITQGEIDHFVYVACKKHGASPVWVTLSNRKTRRRWGTAWPTQRRVTMYRHSVWVFLHEMAHMLVPKGTGHGPAFARRLDELIDMWASLNKEEIMEVKVGDKVKIREIHPRDAWYPNRDRLEGLTLTLDYVGREYQDTPGFIDCGGSSPIGGYYRFAFVRVEGI
ncbi:MAG: M48 family metallopeptidase [Porticoccaceae bacterium]|nr:M48 family metallopeptidase [Porticoccaceae bacterium]